MTAYELALSTMDAPSGVSVRLNPFKRPSLPPDVLEGADRVPWSEFGYVLTSRPVFTLDPLFHAGVYYVQDSSAMFVGHVARRLLPEKGPVRVLDLCAAPGGKTTDLAASLRMRYGNDFLLVSNEVMAGRVGTLANNVSLWGDPNVTVTSVDPSAFAEYGGFFDMIVADVPCSGEGMFRKDSGAAGQWTPQIVGMCARRQRRILADVWPSLKQGGVLVYSTCTFEESENDANLEWAAEELGGRIYEPESGFAGVRTTRCGNMLVPGEVPGEGQWVGALCKTSEACSGESDISRLHPRRTSMAVKGKGNVPDPDRALSIDFDRESYPLVEVDRMTALHFLHRDTVVLPGAPSGYLVLTYRDIPIGFVKNLGTRCNNLHPMGRRILMDIDRI